MNPAFWGAASALNLGTADFMARYSSRAIGHASALLAMLATGVLLLSLWMVVVQPPLVWDLSGWHLLLINGIATTVMTLLLYKGLARGPISVVAPIVASHPVLVVTIAVALGARPSAIDWAAMAVTIIGVVIVAQAGQEQAEDNPERGAKLRGTIAISIGSMLAYAVLVSAGQQAVPIYGELQTLWIGRIISLIALMAFMAASRQRPVLPMRWWPFLAAQGTLDAGGYLALFAGSAEPGAEIVAVIASTFGVITVLLALVILRERVGALQWLGIVLTFIGVGTLSA